MRASATSEADVYNRAAFLSPTTVARWVVLLLVGTIVLRGVSMVVMSLQLGLLDRIEAGSVILGEAAANNSRQQALAWLAAGLYIATGIAFVAWLRRVYGNLTALSSRQRSFARGWAIGAWFVPFLNFVRPFQIVNETGWVSAHPTDADQAVAGVVPPAPALMRWWWGFWLLSLLVGRLALSFSQNAKTIDELRMLTNVLIFVDVIDVAAAVLVIQIVRQISAQQSFAMEKSSSTPVVA